jgi:ligand-binding SRPBCC domain-containing protein
MKEFTFRGEIWLPRGRDEVFAFFTDVRNLEIITPPWLNFEVLGSTPVAINKGALIDYRVRVHGIPIRWRAEISE